MLLKYAASVSLNHKRLANALGIHSTTFSRRLNSRSTHPFTLIEVKTLIELLTREGALSSVRQARELLQLLYPENDFSKEELALPPLSRLSLLPSDNHKGYPTGEAVAVQDLIIKPRPGLLQRRGIKSVGPGLDEGGGSAGQHGSSGGLGTGAARWDEDNEDGTPGLIPLTTGVPLIGRDKELEQARNWLVDKDSSVKVLTIAGPGGVGKTSLATALARQLLGSGEYPDGVVWVDLTLLPTGTTPRELNEAIAHAMGLTLQVGVAVENLIRNYLAGKRLLVLLDNFEQLQGSDKAIILQRLTGNNPGLRVVVTSRHLLKLPVNSQTLKLAPLTYPRVGESLPPVIELAEKYSAVELFVRQARLLEPNFALGEGNAGAVVELCQRLDGVPLAIAIAAARVRQFGVAGVLDRINRHGALPMLEDEGQEAERHQSQAATIGWSYDLLTEEERRVWRGLAVFAGSVGIEAIERVLGEGLSAVEVDTRIVGGLVDKSMLFKVEDSMVGLAGLGVGGGSESRYYLHGVMREYALDRVREQAGEEDRVREAHARYYLALAEEAGPKLNGPERARWSARLGVEYENVKAALGWLVEHGAGKAGSSTSMVEEAYRLAGAMGQYWFSNRLVAEGQSWLERVLTLGEAPAAIKAEVLHQLGRMLNIQGNRKNDYWQRAEKLFQESLAIWQESGDLKGQDKALTNLGNIAYKLQNYQSAIELYSSSLELAKQTVHTLALTNLYANLGHSYTNLADYDRAKEYFEQALLIKESLEDKEGVANNLRDLGLVLIKNKDTEQARVVTERSLRLYEELNNKTGQIEPLLNLGQIAQLQSNFGRVKRYYTQSLQLSIEQSFFRLLPSFTLRIALFCLQRGALEPALRLLGAVQYFLELDDRNFDAGDKSDYEQASAKLKDAVEADRFDVLWDVGRDLAGDSLELANNLLVMLQQM